MTDWEASVTRKLALGLGVELLGCAWFVAIMIGPRFIQTMGPGQDLGLTPAAFATIFAGFAYTWRAIRCPACGFRLFAHNMRHGPLGSEVLSLYEIRSCPDCGVTLQDPDDSPC